MPEWMSKPQEKDWKESVKIVEKGKDSKKDKFKDQDWGLSMHIWKAKEKKHRGKKDKKKDKKKKSDLVYTVVALATKFDELQMFEYASRGRGAGRRYCVTSQGYN